MIRTLYYRALYRLADARLFMAQARLDAALDRHISAKSEVEASRLWRNHMGIEAKKARDARNLIALKVTQAQRRVGMGA